MAWTIPSEIASSPKAHQYQDKRWASESHWINQDFESYSDQLKTDWALLGYPDDEGIQINKGRVGAALGPNSIRELFFKTAFRKGAQAITDIGDLQLEGSLAERHERAKKILNRLHSEGQKIITLGGGHDYGYPDGAAFLETYRHQKSVVINFDAHLDVRAPNPGLSSGTPFYRLKEEFPKMNLIQFGIQPQCNSDEHTDWCRQKNIEIIHWPALLKGERPMVHQLAKALNSKDLDACVAFISVDIDVFNSGIAPGCSQSWPTGLTANQFYLILDWLKTHLNIRHLGIYEVSPPLDPGVSTLRLAAQIMHQLLTPIGTWQ